MSKSNHPHAFSGCYLSESRNALLGPDNTIRPIRAQCLTVVRYLSDKAGSVVEKDSIIDEVWKDVQATDDSLVQCISQIRKVLGDKEHKVLT